MIRRTAAAFAAAAALSLVPATSAMAHWQTVQPPSKDSPVVSGPISNPWAHAHCASAAPGVVGAASGGVVDVTPHHLDC